MEVNKFQKSPEESSQYNFQTIFNMWNYFKRNPPTAPIHSEKDIQSHTQEQEEGPMSPFLVPEILEALLDKMDVKQILKARLICKLWNVEAAKSIRKRIKEKEFQSKCISLNLPLEPKSTSLYRYLPNALTKSKLLDIFLSNVTIFISDKTDLVEPSPSKFEILRNFWTPKTKSEEKPKPLQYGPYVKEICIFFNWYTHYYDPRHLVRLITKSCPNLEEMMIGSPIHHSTIDETAFDFADNQGLLKLKHLEFFAGHVDVEEIIIEKNVYILIKLLRHSPKLVSFSLEFCCESFWIGFVAEVSKIPKMLSNISEISLKGNILDLLGLFNKIKFGLNLTTVKFHNILKHEHFKEDFVFQLKFFMMNVGIQLKHLEFEQSKDEDQQQDDFEDVPLLIIEDNDVIHFFPKMPLLKKFNTFFLFESFKFLERMPNVTQLSLCKITNIEQMLDHPCLNNKIQEITFGEFEGFWDDGFVFQKIFSSDTIQKINLGFPNLTEFNLELNPSTVLTSFGLKLWFENVCKELSDMKQLKRLKILVFPSDYDCYHQKELFDWYSQVNLEDGFNILKTIPNLRSLILGHALIQSDGLIKNDGRVVHFPRAPLIKLLEAPKLTRLKLSGLIVDAIDSSEVEEVAQFHEQFSNSRVLISTVNNTDSDWMADD